MKKEKTMVHFIVGLLFFGCACYGALNLFSLYVAPFIMRVLSYPDMLQYTAIFVMVGAVLWTINRYRSRV